MRLLAYLIALAVLALAAGCAARLPYSQPVEGPSLQRAAPASAGPAQFLHAAGEQLVDEAGQSVRLRGMAFGNRVWAKERIPVRHHGERDYAHLGEMGMSLVRFYLYYGTLESDAEPYHYLQDGWNWLDQNVAWARVNGVYLVFNVHVPQGGFQSLGGGSALWSDPENQKRFIAMWRAVAQRTSLAIREVDTRHPIIVERVNAVGGSWHEDAFSLYYGDALTIDRAIPNLPLIDLFRAKLAHPEGH